MSRRPTLVEILARYSDAVFPFPQGTDKNTAHCYGPFYEILLKPLRLTATDVLEIGIRGGGSLCAWADYFENARITGVDIQDWGAVLGKDRPNRIAMHFVDATVEAGAAQVGGTYDFIIDDGSHRVEDQIAALRVWGPRIKPGGMFIIEDIFPYNVQRIKDECEPLASSMGLEFDLYDWNYLNPFDNTSKNDIVAVFSRPSQ